MPMGVTAQLSAADSLAKLLRQTPPDTNRVNLLNDLAWEYKFENPSRARSLLDSAIQLARALRFPKGEATALNFRGVVEDIHGNSDQAIEYFQQALAIRQRLGDLSGVASLYNNLGNVMENRGDYLAALENYQQSLRLREQLRDTVRIMRAWYNMAILQESMGNYPEALDYIFRFLEYAEPIGDRHGMANAWNIIGNIKVETDRYDEALVYYQKAYDEFERLGNRWEMSSVLNNIANLMDAMGEARMDRDDLSDSTLNLFRRAIEMHQKALTLRTELEDIGGQAEIFNNMGYVLKNLGSFYKKRGDQKLANQTWLQAETYLRKALAIHESEGNQAGIMEVYNGLADVRRRQHRFREALEFTKKYYDIAVAIQDAKFQQNGLKDLARIHYELGNYKTAYEYRKAYDELRYARFNEERIKSEERREIAYSDRKKQWEIERQQTELKLRDAQLKTARTVQAALMGGAALFILLAFVLYNRNQVIRREKQRSEHLLLNILPAQTAEELKTRGKATARRYDEATVLFTDFVGFTHIAENCDPEELVRHLDTCFAAFDEIAARHGVEKIKTIGDAWLGVAGVPTPQRDHAERAVRAALEMQAFMKEWRQHQRQNGLPEYFCRIGIHSGPVVAGVVGKRKFAYDIWGDTVNIAARMESAGQPDEVNISRATSELLSGRFTCIPRGSIEVKNKGALEMFFVKMANQAGGQSVRKNSGKSSVPGSAPPKANV